jgi:hypothetical protein
VLVKKLVWFVVNFIGMITPFKQMKKVMVNMYERVREISVKLAKLSKNNSNMKFLHEV